LAALKTLIHLYLKNHKTKVKENARRTHYQSIDFELWTATKDYENCVLHATECEVISQIPTTVLTKLIGEHNDCDSPSIECTRNGICFTIDYNHPNVMLGYRKKPMQWASQFFTKNDFLTFVKDNDDIEIDYGNTQFNCEVDDQVVKIYGDPIINHHDWVVIVYEGRRMLCHILCFVNVTTVITPLHFDSGVVNIPGIYAICHYVNQDVFQMTNLEKCCLEMGIF